MDSNACLHCGTPTAGRFCCAGCENVHALLVGQGLTRYYTLAGRDVAPAPAPEARSLVWLEPLLARALADGGPGLKTLSLDVQGVHCAACVWLFEETFRRHGGARATVNAALGRVHLAWEPERADVAAWVRAIEGFGYALGPPVKARAPSSNALPLRLGVCAAITLNVMLFSLSFYFGLSPRDGDVFTVFAWLSAVLSTAVVVIGGWPFFRGAVFGLRQRVLHLDLPIALGILFVWATSIAQAGGEGTYFDTLNTFITLMLFGRWLQQRVLDRNRRFLLEDDGAQGLFVRRVRGPRVEVVPVPRIRAGDGLLIAPGDLVPVDAQSDAIVEVRTDWITGESDPRRVRAGDPVPAGSFNAGARAFTATAATGFDQSPLVALLRQPPPRDPRTAEHLRFWDRLARRWVVQVLIAAGVGFLIWLPAGTGRALEVATALLVVTCPCAIGIALPLAYELVQARLRRAGFYVRGTDLLDRLTRVRTVVFDKTGTLTLGRLQLANPEVLDRLDVSERAVLANLCARSGHPVSQAIAEALPSDFDPSADVVELPGRGLEWKRADGTWRLGRPDWVGCIQSSDAAVLSHDGEPRAGFAVREALRPGAAEQVRALAATGRDLWLLSGDAPARVAALAGRLGFAPDHAIGALSPEDKAARVRALGDGVLYLGDGVNDAQAFGAALCAGTPAIERPVMPSRSDFFLVGAGLDPLQRALADAARLRTVVRRVLGLSLAYNAIAIAAALAGWMSPLKAAIFMPLSSLSLLIFTGVSLAPRRPPAPAAPARPVQEVRA